MKYLLCFLILNCCLAASYAQPKKVIADRIIAVVGDKIVLKSDIAINMFGDKAAQWAGRTIVVDCTFWRKL